MHANSELKRNRTQDHSEPKTAVIFETKPKPKRISENHFARR